ncbi:hypothetical protein [Pseudanabaena sp. UWO310]|uniref:hypothetical protein n=1 Tax=Pseudanabaena sp. UWO310 TaxID=2480795 RepID=UPI001158C0B1|nr:hypothetical protein [Pseudanabaena sp. UWO310]TYQ29978.1 hypothetical protein PseudUWO310_11195 [Pseudanabaena sp. UWO310]
MTMPTGYYGLELSESAQLLIHSLTYDQILDLIYDLATHLSTIGKGERFYAMSMTLIKWFEDEVEDLPRPKKIAFLQWAAERLAELYTEPINETFDGLFDLKLETTNDLTF